MSARRIIGIGLAVVLLVGSCVVFGMMTMLGALSGSQAERQAERSTAGACNQDDPEVRRYTGKTLTFKDLSAAQRKNATTIVTVGVQMRTSDRDQAIAIAVSMVEATLTDKPHATDHDSIGIFQQRPSMGWGNKPAYKGDTRSPVERLRDASYASARFYEKLLRIPNRPGIEFGRLAQRVQISAFPDRYGRYEALGNSVVSAAKQQGLVSAAPVSAASPTPDCKEQQRRADANPGTVTGKVSAKGWTWPAPGRAGSGYRTVDRPSHAGVDIIAARYAQIGAAAPGVVTKVKCNASTGNCDVDGGISVKGCGWYVEITHGVTQTAAGTATVMTRYCHMTERPVVTVGQHVVAGQKLGRVGSSGNSSGPHLHFEVRLNGNDISPLPWMASHGVTPPGYIS